MLSYGNWLETSIRDNMNLVPSANRKNHLLSLSENKNFLHVCEEDHFDHISHISKILRSNMLLLSYII